MALLPVERPYHVEKRLSQVIAAVMTRVTCLRRLVDVRRNVRVFAQQPHAKCVMGSVAIRTGKLVHGRISAQLRFRATATVDKACALLGQAVSELLIPPTVRALTSWHAKHRALPVLSRTRNLGEREVLVLVMNVVAGGALDIVSHQLRQFNPWWCAMPLRLTPELRYP